MVCECCDSFGMAEGPPYATPDGPYYPTWRCTACDGDHHYEVEVEPVEASDLEAWALGL